MIDEGYSRLHRHVLAKRLPPLLERVARRGVIADLGAGDGVILWELERRGLIERAFAVDASPERVKVATSLSPSFVGIVADAVDVGELSDDSVDGVIASQLIEHLPDDKRLAPEIARLLKPGGWWYVGSVLRGHHAWWFYRVGSAWRLDPTHVREYESVDAFTAALRHPALSLSAVNTKPLRYPLVELGLRALTLARLVPPDSLAHAYRGRPWLEGASRAVMRVPGYWLLEAAGAKVA